MTAWPGAPAGDAGRPVWTVGQVNEAARGLLEREAGGLWVRGETANFHRAQSGHCYFTLKDEAAEIACVLFRWDAQRLVAEPEDGAGVRVYGGLTLYEPKGRFQMRVRRLETEGAEGRWKRLFEELRGRLEREGLIDPERRRPLPRFPRTVGVVTSLSSAALRDVASVVARRAPWVRLLVRGTRVQGDGAAREIADALSLMARRRPDVVVVARGGGSLEDLWAFNEEAVARAVAASPVPVVSGVGHETDVTICDLVADLRAPTPSAAAEAVVPEREVVAQRLDEQGRRMRNGLAAKAGLARMRLASGRGGLLRRSRRLAAGRRRCLAEQSRRMEEAVRRRIGMEAERLAVRRSVTANLFVAVARSRAAWLAKSAAALQARSPRATLRRGFAIPTGLDGEVLRRVRDFAAGRNFRLEVVDGSVECRALNTEAGLGGEKALRGPRSRLAVPGDGGPDG